MIIIVAQDGSGQYTSIQQAVDAAPDGGRSPAIVLVRAGVYRERVVVHRDNLRIVGESADNTVVTASACAIDPGPDGQPQGTFQTATFMVTGHNVEVENLTIRNDAGDGRVVGQAVAVYAAGDRGVWRHVRMIAHQDTLFCGPLMPKVADRIAPRQGRAEVVPSVGDSPLTHSRQYFEDCYIQGDVDFIFGPYCCWFERCTLVMNARGGYYTAANTPEPQPCGLVFHACTLTGECADGAAFLGRPWRRYARTVFLNCEMDARVSPQGFADWDDATPVTERCAEYGTTGARAALSERHPKQRRLSAMEARAYTVPQVIGGWDHWRPDRPTPTWYLCGDSTMADYPAERAPMMGWGQQLQPLLNDPISVQNLAVNGRSSKSFIDEGRLWAAERCLRPGDRLIVSFSHNDEKADPARHTDPETTFPQTLGQYIDAARRHGAEPILVTPIARRLFDGEGRLLPTHGAYPDALRRTAKARGVRLVDLEQATMRLFQREGPEGTKRIFCHLPAGSEHYPDGLEDNSHLQADGAALVALAFLDGLASPEDDMPTPDAAPAVDAGDLIAREDSVMT